jgi:hypothetical protein
VVGGAGVGVGGGAVDAGGPGGAGWREGQQAGGIQGRRAEILGGWGGMGRG